MSDETKEFVHSGLQCKLVKQSRLGHWCGYVRVPEDVGPVRWTGDYDSKHNEVLDAEVDVWGGITYGPDKNGWVGFDDGHSRPINEHCHKGKSRKKAVKEETKCLAEQIVELKDD